MTENDILGFDPQSLFEQNEQKPQNSQGNLKIYKPRPIDSKSEDGIYRSTIKVVYNPFSPKQSILDQQSYAINDSEGWLTVVSSLTVNDTSCPIFKAWKKCHFAKKEEHPELWKQAAKEEEGGRALFDKRYSRWCVIQILEDDNQPDLVGKFMFWKLPKSIYDLIMNKQNPSAESKKAPIPVMDYLFGRSIDLTVNPGPGKPGEDRYARETKYIGEISEDIVSCINPDGSPLLNDDEQDILDTYVAAMKKVWKEKDPEKRVALKAEIDASENTKALSKFYNEKIFPMIKSWCPNLIEELGYKPWTPEVTARVQRWIDVVLAGNDPRTADNAPVVANTVGTTNTTEQIRKEENNEVVAPTEDTSTDDLPF